MFLLKLKITVISLMILIAYQILIKESFKLRLIIKVEKRSNTILNYYLNF